MTCSRNTPRSPRANSASKTSIPQPDTDAEDSANLDGINGQRMDDQNLYFGLAISCLDKHQRHPLPRPAR